MIKECKKENLTPTASCPKITTKDCPKAPQLAPQLDYNKEIEFNFCYDILEELKNKPYAYTFYKYNNVKKSEISDNSNITRHPMDLFTINSNLENNQYTNILEEFEKDIHLLFHNCFTYNDKESEVYHLGKTLESAFNKKWANKPVFQDKQKGKLKTARDDNTKSTFIGKYIFKFYYTYIFNLLTFTFIIRT